MLKIGKGVLCLWEIVDKIYDIKTNSETYKRYGHLSFFPFILKVPLKQKQILVNIFLDSKNLKFKLIY